MRATPNHPSSGVLFKCTFKVNTDTFPQSVHLIMTHMLHLASTSLNTASAVFRQWWYDIIQTQQNTKKDHQNKATTKYKMAKEKGETWMQLNTNITNIQRQQSTDQQNINETKCKMTSYKKIILKRHKLQLTIPLTMIM